MVRQLSEELGEVDDSEGDSWLDAAENRAVELADAVSAAFIAQQSSKRQVSADESTCPECGKPGSYVGDRPRELITRRGPAAITEPEYFCPCCRKVFFPMTPAIGVEPECPFTPAMLRKVVYAGSQSASFMPATIDLAALAEAVVSRERVQRWTKRIGQQRSIEAHVAAEDVAYVSPSTVYRILREANLVCPWRRRTKRRREELEKAQRPNERWGTDLMYLRIGAGQYYLVTFLDEYSRYLVHWELLTGHGWRERGSDKEQNSWDGTKTAPPEIRSDNGSCYVSREFREVLVQNGLAHQRIKPNCPEENGLVERSNGTLRDALEVTELTNRQQAEYVLAKFIGWYNGQRLNRALGYLRPVDYYRGQPDELHEACHQKLARARHRRRERNLNLKQPTLTRKTQAALTNQHTALCHCR